MEEDVCCSHKGQEAACTVISFFHYPKGLHFQETTVKIHPKPVTKNNTPTILCINSFTNFVKFTTISNITIHTHEKNSPTGGGIVSPNFLY